MTSGELNSLTRTGLAYETGVTAQTGWNPVPVHVKDGSFESVV